MHITARPTQIHVLPGYTVKTASKNTDSPGLFLKCFLLINHMVVDSRRETALHLSMHPQGVILEMTVCNCLVPRA